MSESRPDPSLVEELIADVLLRLQSGEDALDAVCSGQPDEVIEAVQQGLSDLEAMGLLPVTPPSGGESSPPRIGRYPIHGELGRGGLGVVYLGFDPRLGRWLAIKRLPDSLSSNPEARHRFEREAKLLAALDHPHIGTIHSIEDDEDGPYLTLALAEGETLADRLATGPLEIELAVSVLRQIASALEAAHADGILHRDLKPQNIMLNDANQIKVLDFGLGKFHEEDDAHNGEVDQPVPSAEKKSGEDFATERGALIGTPGYMAPEQILTGQGDNRIDIFAWGCVAFECLCGSRAISGTDVSSRIAGTLKGEIDFQQLPATLNTSFRQLLEQTLSIERAQRPSTMAEIRRVLDAELARETRARWTADSRQSSNLPEPWNRFIGRHEICDESLSALATGRLISLVGPGGAGKTRLSIEVAQRYRQANLAERSEGEGDGPWWVDLSAVTDPSLVAVAVAGAVTDRPPVSNNPLGPLIDVIGESRALIVIDNCEHQIQPVSDTVVQLLKACPELRILTTSRSALGVNGERVFRVPPLSVPAEDSDPGAAALRKHEAIELFEDRAKEARHDFELIDDDLPQMSEICRRLDGLPLAIELAAAQVSRLSIGELTERLGAHLGWLKAKDRTRQPRQQTLRSLVDWSHELLSPSQQILYRRLSVFAGSSTLESIEAVTVGDGLHGWEIFETLGDLIDQSLLEADLTTLPTGETVTRYRMLEVLREDARERLDEVGESDALLLRHSEKLEEFAGSLAPDLEGPAQVEGLAKLEFDRANLRAVIERAAARGDLETGARLLTVIWRFYSIRGHWIEARRLIERLLQGAADDSAEQPGSSRLLRLDGLMAMQMGDLDEADSQLRRGLEIDRASNDRAQVSAALDALAQLELRRGQLTEAREHFLERRQLADELGDRRELAVILARLGNVEQLAGDLAAAKPYFEESLKNSEELGDGYLTAGTLHNLASIYLTEGDRDQARQSWKSALELNRRLGNRAWQAHNLISLGHLEKLEANYSETRRNYEAATKIYRELKDQSGLRDVVLRFGMLAASLGQHRRALKLIAAGLSFSDERGMSLASGSRGRLDDQLSAIEENLSEEEIRETHAAGAALSLEDALQWALDE